MYEQDWIDSDVLIASYLSGDPDVAKQLVDKPPSSRRAGEGDDAPDPRPLTESSHQNA